MSSARSRLIVIVALLLAACGDSTQPDQGGSWTATVTGTGAQSAGAGLIELTGTGIDGVSALDAQTFAHAAGDTTRVVVVRAAPGPLRFTVQLARGATLPRATVLELADGSNTLLTPATTFTVSFTR